jgi:hypothetical protein
MILLFPGPLPKDTPIRRPKTPPVVPKVEKLELQPMSPIKEESDSEPGILLILIFFNLVPFY